MISNPEKVENIITYKTKKAIFTKIAIIFVHIYYFLVENKITIM